MCYSYSVTSSDKTIIYNLLKKISDNYYGYASPDFCGKPVFSDDAVQTAEEAQVNDAVPQQSPLTLEKITEKIHNCTRCGLAPARTNTVPGMGVPHPDVLVIGEGPGEQEDKQGLPFVGPAGQLLDKMLAAIQLDRNVNCYIANIVKCRPPYNRTPNPDEANMCRPFLDAQIHLLKPGMILCAGRTAAQNLLHIDTPLSRIRGTFYDYNGIPVLATYHPSALLREPANKRYAWEDLKLFKSKLLECRPDYAKGFTERG